MRSRSIIVELPFCVFCYTRLLLIASTSECIVIFCDPQFLGYYRHEVLCIRLLIRFFVVLERGNIRWGKREVAYNLILKFRRRMNFSRLSVWAWSRCRMRTGMAS